VRGKSLSRRHVQIRDFTWLGRKIHRICTSRQISRYNKFSTINDLMTNKFLKLLNVLNIGSLKHSLVI